MSVSFAQRVVIAPDVLARVINDEAVLLHLKTEQYVGLDPVGTRMWTVLQESPSIEAALATLAGEYEVSDDELRRDLTTFVGDLLEQSLVEVLPA